MNIENFVNTVKDEGELITTYYEPIKVEDNTMYDEKNSVSLYKYNYEDEDYDVYVVSQNGNYIQYYMSKR